jgi:hypothetical protein
VDAVKKAEKTQTAAAYEAKAAIGIGQLIQQKAVLHHPSASASNSRSNFLQRADEG